MQLVDKLKSDMNPAADSALRVINAAIDKSGGNGNKPATEPPTPMPEPQGVLELDVAGVKSGSSPLKRRSLAGGGRPVFTEQKISA